MGRRWLAIACAVAGVAVLAGAGWALLAAGALIALNPAPPMVGALVARARRAVWVSWRWLVASRQAAAAAAMPLAVVGIAVGLALAIGVGWGVAAAGFCVAGLSLAADRAG